jgi:hypothetical protein
MSQANLIGLCSDNLVTILQPSSTIECIGSASVSGILGPVTVAINGPAQTANPVPLNPGKYMLSVNLQSTANTDLSGNSISFRLQVGSYIFPFFIPSNYILLANTILSASCNYVQTTGPITVAVTTNATITGSTNLTCSVFYVRVS